MNLVLDFGNTRIKAALFSGDKILEQKAFSSLRELLDAGDILSKAEHSIICSVTRDHEVFLKEFQKKNILLFSADTPLPLKNLYKSAATLGSDRIAASVGAYSVCRDKNVLTIDAGTCIKYNFVNTANEYIGGAISPGLMMRLKALHEYTARLPFIEPDFNYEKLTGENTAESILTGALVAAAAEVDGMIGRYRDVYPDLHVFITGGDSAYLSKQLKNRIFAHPDLLLTGLNTILNFNIEK